MHTAVALVQAYLQVNGYFTVAECPALQGLDRGGYRTVTDIDLRALRLPWAGGLVPARRKQAGLVRPSSLRIRIRSSERRSVTPIR